jgi:hypothetical protein
MSKQQHPQMTIAGVPITNAYVDLTGAGAGTLYVKLDGSIPKETFFPVEDEPVGASTWLAESDDGLFEQYQDHPAQPPADERPKTATSAIPHADLGGTEDRVTSYTHVTKSSQNKRKPESCIEVRYINGRTNTYPTRIETAAKIVDTYINGDAGSECVSYWAHSDDTSWGPGYNADYDGYIDCTPVFVYDKTYTWLLKRLEDVGDNDILFEYDRDYVVVINDEYDSVWKLFETEYEAREYVDDVNVETRIESVSFDQ